MEPSLLWYERDDIDLNATVWWCKMRSIISKRSIKRIVLIIQNYYFSECYNIIYSNCYYCSSILMLM